MKECFTWLKQILSDTDPNNRSTPLRKYRKKPQGEEAVKESILSTENKQKLRVGAPAPREARCCSAQLEATLQDALSDVDWDLFQEAPATTSICYESGEDFIAQLLDDIVPAVTVKVFPNQK